MILEKEKTVLVVIDMQEAFRESIANFAEIAARIAKAVRGFRILGLPVIVTEQYPKGLGRTAQEISDVLPDNFEPVEKTAFSSCGALGFLDKLEDLNARQVLLCGIEAHICVNQTAHDLLKKGFEVHLLQDSVGARFEYNRLGALRKMDIAGVIPSSVEMALFELLRDAKSEHFKEIQKLIK